MLGPLEALGYLGIWPTAVLVLGAEAKCKPCVLKWDPERKGGFCGCVWLRGKCWKAASEAGGHGGEGHACA